MSPVFGSGEIGVEFCKILGLEPSRVGSLTLNIGANAVVTVDVVMYPSGDQLERFAPILKKYKLEPI